MIDSHFISFFETQRLKNVIYININQISLLIQLQDVPRLSVFRWVGLLRVLSNFLPVHNTCIFYSLGNPSALNMHDHHKAL